MAPLKFITLLISLSVITSCSSKRDTPEEVLHEFYTALQEGDCEKLKSVSSNEGIEMMSDWIALDCEPINITLDSIYCNTSDSIADCTCYETRENGSMKFYYTLELIEDEWKVTPWGKDLIDY